MELNATNNEKYNLYLNEAFLTTNHVSHFGTIIRWEYRLPSVSDMPNCVPNDEFYQCKIVWSTS